MTAAASYNNLVQELYIAYFGRPADYYGLQNFEVALEQAGASTDPAGLANAYGSNAAVKSLIDSFGTSAESLALYGSGSTASFVNAVFENLFNRPAAVAGLSFWVNAIDSGAVGKGDAALAILAGAFAASGSAADQATINNKVAVAEAFTTALGASSTEIVAYAGAVAAADARLLIAGVGASTNPATVDVQGTIDTIVGTSTSHTYTLTTGVDQISGGTGNDTFNAVLDNAAGLAAGGQAATLQTFDSITGGTLSNTLNIDDFGTGGSMSLPSGARITGMTTLNVNSLEAVTLDTSGWSRLGKLNVLSSQGNDDVTVAPGVAVNVQDGYAASTVTVHGGATISVAGSGGADLNGASVYGDASTTAVSLADLQAGFIYDLNHGTGKANTIAAVSLTDTGAEIDIYDDGLTTLTMKSTSAGNMGASVVGSTAVAQFTVNLDGEGRGYVADDSAAKLVVNASGSAVDQFYIEAQSATSIVFNDAAGLRLTNNGYGSSESDYSFDAVKAAAITITGAGDFTADFGSHFETTHADATAAIDASASSGIITVEIGSGQSFAGGSGQDVVTIYGVQTGTVAGGSASDNEIVLSNVPGASEADLAGLKNFSIFGVAGSTSGSFDMSKLSGYSEFDVQGSGGNVSFANAASGAGLSLENGNGHSISLQLADTTGAADSVNLNLGSSGKPGNFYSSVTLEDADFNGIATVNLASYGSTAHTLNGLGHLLDNNLVTLNISGNAALDVINAISTSSSSFTLNDTSTSAISTALIANITDNNLAQMTFAGTAPVTIIDFNTTSEVLSITDSDTAAVLITGYAMGSLASLTSLTIDQTSSASTASFAIGPGINEANLSTLDLSGNVAINVHVDKVSTGITINAGSDNATVYFEALGGNTQAGKTDTATLGNGNYDMIEFGSGAVGSTQTVVLGSGSNDSVFTHTAGTLNVTLASHSSGLDGVIANAASVVNVTAGDGSNLIVAGAAGAQTTVSVGSGSNGIIAQPGAYGSIALAAHTSATSDSISIGASGTSLIAIEKISGLNNAGSDVIQFTDNNAFAGFTQVTQAEVAAAGGDTTLLADWVATADGKGGGVTGTGHDVVWFQYQGNTYLLESVAGQTSDAGTMQAGNTLVELSGTGYTFSKATGSGGALHLLG